MLTDGLEKGDRIQMRNGWYGTINDDKRGNIRNATIEGIVTETGDVYAHDIMFYIVEKKRLPIEHTKQQIAARKLNEDLFGD